MVFVCMLMHFEHFVKEPPQHFPFAGNVLKERQKIQPASGASTYNLDRAYTYDERMRLTGVTATLNGATCRSWTSDGTTDRE